MGLSKSDLFTQEQNELVGILKAMAHPARVAIIQYLIKANACINGDLVEELGLAQATISQHLKELKQVGIIQGSIEGKSISYCINKARWNEIKEEFDSLFESINTVSCC